MQILPQKSNGFFLSCFLLLLVSCASNQYKVYQRDGENVALLVTPDRVIVECEDLYAGGSDRPGSFGFLIYILDEEKTVLGGFQTTQTSKDDCHEKVHLIQKILKTSKKVYVAGRVDLDEPRKPGKRAYTFPGLGTFRSNERVMSWSVLKGEDGTCVTAHRGSGKPCPWDPIFIGETIPF